MQLPPDPAPAPEVPPAQATAAELPPETEPEAEEKTSEPDQVEEEKTSAPESSAEVDDYTGPKVKVYNGKGRRHTDKQMDEILDWFLLYGELPDYVTPRQRRDYKKHPRLELRRLYLEQAGFFKQLHDATRHAEDAV